MGEFIELFDRLALPMLLPTLGHPLGVWTSHGGPLNQFIHPRGHDSLAGYEQRCPARDTHPGFPKDIAASERLIVVQETRLIKAVTLPALTPALAHREGGPFVTDIPVGLPLNLAE